MFLAQEGRERRVEEKNSTNYLLVFCVFVFFFRFLKNIKINNNNKLNKKNLAQGKTRAQYFQLLQSFDPLAEWMLMEGICSIFSQEETRNSIGQFHPILLDSSLFIFFYFVSYSVCFFVFVIKIFLLGGKLKKKKQEEKLWNENPANFF